MSTEVTVAVVSAVVSLLGAVLAGVMTSWSARRTKRYETLIENQQKAQSKAEQAEEILSRYREPLLNAAHDLQGRLYNIVKRAYLTEYLHCDDPDLERYARDYTIYTLAEYMCWAEIIRRDLRFLDLGGEAGNRELVRLLEATQGAISYEGGSRPLRLFRGEQRAIGELMMTPVRDADSARFESLGYVAFCEKIDNDPTFQKWFRRLRDDVDAIVASDHSKQDRLITLQNDLIDLINFLDPKGARLPMQYRRKLDGPKQPPSDPV
jgi:hypothetical protein